MIVADTNLVSHLLFDAPESSLARAVWFRDRTWRLPALWRSEFLNVLAKSMRAGLMEGDEAHEWWHRAHWMFSGNEIVVDGDAVLDLAAARRITAYDAHFVAAALKLNVPLLTVDRGLLAACPDVALPPESFLQG
ncbi:MAG TPA: type II toxin-antitoxin system VapC family toxin [Thermoanaerobaculia bacterium]|nr:type II toxin-antitoxin system VapC family toxin [Thermoanaerobaculia bacterium]